MTLRIVQHQSQMPQILKLAFSMLKSSGSNMSSLQMSELFTYINTTAAQKLQKLLLLGQQRQLEVSTALVEIWRVVLFKIYNVFIESNEYSIAAIAASCPRNANTMSSQSSPLGVMRSGTAFTWRSLIFWNQLALKAIYVFYWQSRRLWALPLCSR